MPYFFGPRSENPPDLADVVGLRASDAVWVRMFGNPGIVDGEWPSIGRLDDWDRDRWPMPVFVRHDPLRPRVYKVYYPDDNPNSIGRVERSTPEETAGLPDDGLSGHIYVQQVLPRVLEEAASAPSQQAHRADGVR